MEVVGEQRGKAVAADPRAVGFLGGAPSLATHPTCGRSPAPACSGPRDTVLPGEQCPYFSTARSFHYPFSISQDTTIAVSPGADSRVRCCTTSNGLMCRSPAVYRAIPVRATSGPAGECWA